MKTRILRNSSALLAITFLAASCIEVDDVEEAWGNAKPDPELLGEWVGDNDARCAFIKTEKDYHVTSGTNGLEGCSKSIETNGHKFVIVVDLGTALMGFDKADEDGKSGTLLRYKVDGDKMIMYSLDGEVITEAVKAGKVPGEIDEEGDGSLTVLDAKTIKWLGEVAEGKGWSENIYRKVK